MRSVNRMALAVLLALASGARADAISPGESRIWFDTPCGMTSRDWERGGLIIGNGRIGATVMDGVGEQRLALNEISLWTGGENLPGNCCYYRFGPKADRSQFGCYQPFGDLLVKFPGLDKASDFARGLDLSTGLATCGFLANGVRHERQALASIPDEVIMVTYGADRDKSLTATFTLAPDHDAKVTAKTEGSTGRLAFSGVLAKIWRGFWKSTVVAGSWQSVGRGVLPPVSPRWRGRRRCRYRR